MNESGNSVGATQRLAEFLLEKGQESEISALTPDASARGYFRIRWAGKDAIACVYPEAFTDDLPYLDTTGLFLAHGLPVARIYFTDGDAGMIIHEDFGDRILSRVLANAQAALRDELTEKAIRLIARIQSATGLAFQRGSVASKRRFDREKLMWELDFFFRHFVNGFEEIRLPAGLDRRILSEFERLSGELGTFARVLTHRDYHADNLIIGQDGELCLIDHQDARIGSPAYDLVSLLLDRITKPPAVAEIASRQIQLLAFRAELGLEDIPREDFVVEFDLVAIQRCLKAVGTFSNQSLNLGRHHYLRFIIPMMEVVKSATDRLERYRAIQELAEISQRSFAAA